MAKRQPRSEYDLAEELCSLVKRAQYSQYYRLTLYVLSERGMSIGQQVHMRKPMLNTDWVIKKFRDGDFQVDFHHMQLLQNDAKVKPISFKGKGYARYSESGGLEFRLYASETENTNAMKELANAMGAKAGELFAKDAYYTLHGIDVDGNVWVGEMVLPRLDWTADDNPIVAGDLRFITAGDYSSDARMIEMHFLENFNLPILHREATFSTPDHQYLVQQQDDGFLIRVNSDNPLPPHFAIRLDEALRFLLGQPTFPKVLVGEKFLQLISGQQKGSKTQPTPPIARSSPDYYNKSWELFRSYLTFVVTHAKHQNWHPCTAFLNMAHSASSGTLDVWGVGLGVAVEGLSALVKIERTNAERQEYEAEQKRLQKLQAFLVRQVESRKRMKKFKERVQGSLAGLTKLRPNDRMKWLADQKKITRQHIKAWQSLRNRSVHPNLDGDFDVSSFDFQKAMNDLNQVTVLLHLVVFHLIGYAGPYTDYGTTGFPTKVYPTSANHS